MTTSVLSEKKTLRAELRQAWIDEGNSKRITFRNWVEEMAHNPRGTFKDTARRYLSMLSGSSHTPGPWHVGTKEAHHCVYDSHGWQIADASPLGKDDETEANARTMAASPDLLSICKEIADSKCDLLDSERRIRLYHAINKADPNWVNQ